MDIKPKDAESSADADLVEASCEDTIDLAREKRLVRKLDMWLSPMMVMVFLTSYLDRSNIGTVDGVLLRLGGIDPFF